MATEFPEGFVKGFSPSLFLIPYESFQLQILSCQLYEVIRMAHGLGFNPTARPAGSMEALLEPVKVNIRQ